MLSSFKGFVAQTTRLAALSQLPCQGSGGRLISSAGGPVMNIERKAAAPKTALVGGISSAARMLPDDNGVPFKVTRAQGPYLWDDAGRRYVDFALGFGGTILGHAHADVVA